MTDGEFVGSEWLEYLNACRIHYHIRIRENFYVSRHENTFKAYWLFNDLKLGESKHLDGASTMLTDSLVICPALKSRIRKESQSCKSLSRIVIQRKHLICTARDGRSILYLKVWNPVVSISKVWTWGIWGACQICSPSSWSRISGAILLESIFTKTSNRLTSPNALWTRRTATESLFSNFCHILSCSLGNL